MYWQLPSEDNSCQLFLTQYNVNMKVDEFIRQKIKEGMSQSAFARKCGISQSLVNNVMQGHQSVSLDVTQKIARAYNIRLSEFLTDTPEDERSGYSIQDDGQGGFKKGPFGTAINDKPEPYKPLTDDEKAILEMLKDDPDLARRARRFVQFEKSADTDDVIDQKKVA